MRAPSEGAVLNPDPEKFYTLPDAFDVLGRKHYRDTWTGAEIAARNLSQPTPTPQTLERAGQGFDPERRARAEKAERAKKAATMVGGGVRTLRRSQRHPALLDPQQIQENEKEHSARVRRGTVEAELRRLLYGNGIPAALLNSQDGRLVNIGSALWLADKFTVDFASGQASWADLEEGQQVTYQGVVLVDRPEFDRVAMNTQPLKSKPSKMRRRSGRKRGSGSLTALDKPLLAEMNKMISEENAVSIWAAALKMAPEAAGAGVIESKAKRLARRYREQQN